jgi:hypothetical protein
MRRRDVLAGLGAAAWPLKQKRSWMLLASDRFRAIRLTVASPLLDYCISMSRVLNLSRQTNDAEMR